MGDMGDIYRAQREFKRAARTQWVECSSPGCQFGGNPVKVAPGEACHHCGAVAPGQIWSDGTFARHDEVRRQMDEERSAERKARQRASRQCRHCGKLLASEAGRVNHERDKHGQSLRSADNRTS